MFSSFFVVLAQILVTRFSCKRYGMTFFRAERVARMPSGLRTPWNTSL